MANANIVTEVVKVVQPERVVLEMTLEEASAISQVFTRVGGSPNSTRRGLVDAVQNALEDAGVTRFRYNDPNMDLEGEVYFS